jgi:hypothetical protein
LQLLFAQSGEEGFALCEFSGLGIEAILIVPELCVPFCES